MGFHLSDMTTCDKFHLPDRTICDKCHLPDSTTSDKFHLSDRTTCDKFHMPDRTICDKCHLRDRTICDKCQLPDRTTSDKFHLLDRTICDKCTFCNRQPMTDKNRSWSTDDDTQGSHSLTSVDYSGGHYRNLGNGNAEYSYTYSNNLFIRESDNKTDVAEDGLTNDDENIYEEIGLVKKDLSLTRLKRVFKRVKSFRTNSREDDDDEIRFSISQGRRKQLKDRAKISGEDWDCHDGHRGQVSPVEDVQDDSGFHSSSSLTSVKSGPARPRMKRCESLDLKELIINPQTQAEILWTRSKMDREYRDGGWGEEDKMGKKKERRKSKCLKKFTSVALLAFNQSGVEGKKKRSLHV